MGTEVYIKLWDVDTVTGEVIDIVWRLTEGHYPAMPIDWDDIWDRLNGDWLNDGRYLDLDGCEGSPALIKIKQDILRLRREQ